MKPIVVILPVYNGKPYLQLSVESVLNQSFNNFSFYILDDCSTDGSYEYLQGLNDPRITLLRNEQNRGLFPNLNRLIKSSEEPLIKIWSQDDVMYPGCLQAFCDFHRLHPGLGFSYSQCDHINNVGEVSKYLYHDVTPEIVSRHQHTRIAYFTGSIAGNIANVCLERNALNKVGLFSEDMKISGDFYMWVRLAEYFPTGFINQPLIQLRNHTGQLSRNENYYHYHIKEDLKVYRYLDGYATEAEQKEGRDLLLQHKLLFYYTLMAKALLKGKFSTASAMRNELSSYASLGTLRRNFFRFKICKQKPKPFRINT